MTKFIKISPLSTLKVPQVEAVCDWPEDTFLQGGDRGLVISSQGSYLTAFVEAFPENGFFRGEGVTIEEAEQECWRKYQNSVACKEHVWESRGYKNGAGFCKKCSMFETNVFSGADLGQFCAVCEVGTVWSWINIPNADRSVTEKFYCEEHSEIGWKTVFDFYSLIPEESLTKTERLSLVAAQFYLEDE